MSQPTNQEIIANLTQAIPESSPDQISSARRIKQAEVKSNQAQ